MSPVAQQFAHICPAASSQSQSEEPFSLWNVFSLPLSPALACFWGTVAIGSHRCVMVMAGPVHRHTASVGRGSGYGSAQSPAGGLPSEIGVIRATSSPEAWALVHTHPGSWQNPGGYAPGGTSQHLCQVGTKDHPSTQSLCGPQSRGRHRVDPGEHLRAPPTA